MQSKISFKWLWFSVSTVGIAFSVVIILFLTLDLPVQGSYTKPVGKLVESIQGVDSARLELPVRLTIPKIKVDAAIEYVGVTPQGAMAVPKGPANAAWFNLGSRPGEIGSAVIAGHFGWKNGIPAVFDNVGKLQKGDKLYVKDTKGATIAFVVRELRTFGENEDAGSVFASSDGKAHLNLITCEGVWNAARKSYSNRLVIFADKEMK